MTTSTITTTNSNNISHVKKQYQEQNFPTLEELRISKQELIAGDTKGRVFVRYSPGAVAFPIERNIAITRTDRLIVTKVEEIESIK